MNKFIGTKLIAALAMTRAAYNEYRGWALPADEDGNDDGFLVEYLDGGKANDSRHAGYISWSPKAQFDKAYQPCENMTFGLAIEALKRGESVARAGWNGKGMFVYLALGAHDFEARATPSDATHVRGIQVGLFEKWGGNIVTRLPNLNMRTADGCTLTGWHATQTDMLSDDWQIV